MQVLTLAKGQGRRGRPAKIGGPTELELERGRKVAVWIRAGAVPPKATVELSNADIARLSGISPSAVGYYLNNCYDASEDRVRLPTDETIRRLAEGLRLNYEDGIAARYYVPETIREEPGCTLKSGQIVQIAASGKRFRLTENMLRRLEFEADLESQNARN